MLKALSTHLDKSNNFKPEDFYEFHLTSPLAKDNPVAVGHIHPEIAEILKNAGHVSVNHNDRTVEVGYGKGETSVDEKLVALQKTLIAASRIKANHPDNDELLDVIPTHLEDVDLARSVASCPRTLMPWLGFWMKSAMCIVHDVNERGEPVVWLADVIQKNIYEPETLYDIPGGTGQSGERYDDIVIHEVLAEFGIDLKAAPIHQRVGVVPVSRMDKKGKGSKQQLMAVYTFDLAAAKKQGLVPADFKPTATETPPKVHGWRPHPVWEVVTLLGLEKTLVRGKALATIMALDKLGLWKLPDPDQKAKMDEKIGMVEEGMNGSTIRAVRGKGIDIFERNGEGRPVPLFLGKPAPAARVAALN